MTKFGTFITRGSPGKSGVPEIPAFARERFQKPFHELRVTDVYDPQSGWQKAPHGMKFCTEVASELLSQGVTQVRLKSCREKHEVSILPRQPKGRVHPV